MDFRCRHRVTNVFKSGHRVTGEFRRSQIVTPVAAECIARMGVTTCTLVYAHACVIPDRGTVWSGIRFYNYVMYRSAHARSVDHVLLFRALYAHFVGFYVLCFVGKVYPWPRIGLLSLGEAVWDEPAQYISMRAPETTRVVLNRESLS